MNQPLKLQTMYYIFLRRKQQFEQWVEDALRRGVDLAKSSAYKALAEKFENTYIKPLNELHERIQNESEV